MAAAFLLSGFTSYVTLAASKRSLSPDDFGYFALFWSLGFFAAAVCAAPNEQELARSLTVRLERNEPGRGELRAATRSSAVATATVVVLSLIAFVSGMFGGEIASGVVFAFALLVVGEMITALVRAEMAARRDTAGLVVVVGCQGVIRAIAVVILGITTGSLVLVCLAVTLSAVVPVSFIPRLYRRVDAVHDGDSLAVSTQPVPGIEFSKLGVRKLAVATPPRALFAIGTPILAALIAGDDETAVVGDVLAALSLTSAPVLVAAALQVVLLPQFASLAERGDYDRIRSRTRSIIFVVAVGTAAATALAALAGVQLLELLFGKSPGISAAALAAMTFGAGLLFLANLLVPVCIAVRRYSTVTVSWLAGAISLVVVAFFPGDIAFSIGRAVLVGAAIVVVFLLWGVRTMWLPDREAGHARPQLRRVDNGV